MKVKTITKPLNILSKNYKLEELISDNELLMVCADDFQDEDVDRYLNQAEAEVLTITEEKKLRKRIFYILVESMQNITRHQATDHIPTDGSKPILMMGKQNGQPYIITANPIETSKTEDLSERINLINKTGMGELRQLYRDALKDGEMNDAGGANLGLIDIARKAGGRLQYGFDKVDDTHSYFILKINVDTEV